MAGATTVRFLDPNGIVDTHLASRFVGLWTNDSAASCQVSIARIGSQFRLVSPDGESLHSTLDDLDAAVVSFLNRRSLDDEPGRLHLHAATLSRSGRSVIICAPSGTGKTTTTTALLHRAGWKYQSDEMCGFSSDARNTTTWPKPLSLKLGTRAFLPPDLASTLASTHHPLAEVWTVPAASFGAKTTNSSEPALLIFLVHAGNQDQLAVELDPAEATVRLIENSMDFERFEGNSLETLARLATSCTSLSVERQHPDALADLITTAMEGAGTVASDLVEVIDLTSAPEVADLDMVMTGMTAVIRSRRTGVACSLNHDAALILSSLSTARNAAADERTKHFIEQLSTAGLLMPKGKGE